MSFLHPAIALSGVAAMALPILIHLLFRRRRVSIEWAAMELLREAVRRTNRRLKFEQWLVLVLRCLALLAAGLALAVPVLEQSLAGSLSGSAPRRLVVVVVDNGPTSALRRGEEPELARMLDEVRTMLGEGRGRDRVGIVRAARPAAVVLEPTADAGAVEQAIARIEPMESPGELRQALALAERMILDDTAARAADGVRPEIIVASAFRRASLREGEEVVAPRAADAARVGVRALVPAQDAPTDARVVRVDARPAPAGDAILVRAVVAREGASLEAARAPLFVRVAAQGLSTPPPRPILWEQGQAEASVDFQLVPAGLATEVRRVGVTVAIDDDMLGPGNAAHASVDVRSDIEIGVVGRRASLEGIDLERVPASLWASRALSPAVGSGMRVREIDPSNCDDRALLGLDAIVLARPDLLSPSSADSVARFVRAGGVTVVFPAGDSLAQPWGSGLLPRLGVPLRVSVEAVEHAAPLRLAEEPRVPELLASIGPELAALAAPIEARRTVALSGVSRGEVVLEHADGSPAVVAQAPALEDGREGRGLVVVFASPPELAWTNLPVKPLMVPLFQELVRAGIQRAAGRSEVFVGDAMVGEPSASMRSDRGVSLMLDAKGVGAEPVPHSGLWRSDAGGVVAANLRQTSLELAPGDAEAVRSALAPLGEVRFRTDESAATAQRESAGSWSFALLVAALALLLVEGVLSRLFSHASLRRAAPVEAVAIVGRVRSRQASGGRAA